MANPFTRAALTIEGIREGKKITMQDYHSISDGLHLLQKLEAGLNHMLKRVDPKRLADFQREEYSLAERATSKPGKMWKRELKKFLDEEAIPLKEIKEIFIKPGLSRLDDAGLERCHKLFSKLGELL